MYLYLRMYYIRTFSFEHFSALLLFYVPIFFLYITYIYTCYIYTVYIYIYIYIHIYACIYIYIFLYYHIRMYFLSIVGNNFAQNHPPIVRHSHNWQQQLLRYIAIYPFKVSLVKVKAFNGFFFFFLLIFSPLLHNVCFL